MSSFWGVEVNPGKPYTLTHSDSHGRLRLTQATLGNEIGKGEKGAGGKKCVLQCCAENKDPVFLCVLVPEKSETCHLELEFEEEHVTFSVIGPRSVHLAGYYIADVYEEDMSDSDAWSDSLQGSDDDGLLGTDDDDNMVMIDQMTTDSEDNDSDYDSETDDEEIAYNQHRGKSSVVIEEIQEDDKPAGGDTQKGSNKKKSSENDDNSQLQLVVRTPPAESLESEDEDGFPVLLSESKKSSESVSKKNRNLTKETSNEDRKRKSGAIGDNRDSSGEVKAENDESSKIKKRIKDKSTSVDSEQVNNEEKEIKQQDPPADTVNAKQRKKKKKNISASQADTDQQAAKKKDIHKDGEQLTAQEADKKNKKKKTQDRNKSENQAPTRLKESENKKEALQTRTFGNGMIIQEVEMGKPDGKKATSGKKVSVRYIGKLKNGKIFDSNVGGRPFEFRLGAGEVIKGWDIGVNGMHIGDKRRLTIPPSMGYGSQRVGKIPQNSTLIFDVELVSVR
ncbi:peptidyl-prolyl cis-trans isomerase FKBP53-like [Phragmites australis]|uniref:peptidyl-prolyl cis-trans isomerase FKBP53-like n=1 Tax=Phragmites australis TaxID=29695 RepID=UPI002D769543|nr:peptidyl-prolyl cis-trans isomerase FKBP53-like [Phragmites australis]